jgi:phage-related protein
MNNAEVLIKFKGETKELDKSTKNVGKTIAGLGGKFAKTIGGGMAAAIAIATAALAKLTKESVNVYAGLEQSIGGIETLFQDSADTVIKNAQKAYMTAGISANSYMEQITSFSASLLQSVGKDTQKAAQIGDMAMQDMADNANKFGTAIESIQNAYQGFAKQNYTMLDNLKLG